MNFHVYFILFKFEISFSSNLKLLLVITTKQGYKDNRDENYLMILKESEKFECVSEPLTKNRLFYEQNIHKVLLNK